MNSNSLPPNFIDSAGIWAPPLKKCIRIVFGNSPDEMRALLWVTVSQDGSLYLGPRHRNAKTQKIGSGTLQDGKATIKYKDGTLITDKDALKHKKISFHASGTIHAGGKRFFRETLRGISERQKLCIFLPQEIDKFSTINKIRDHDVCLNYPVNSVSPVACEVYVGPLAKLSPLLRLSSVDFQYSVILQYENLPEIGEFFVQLIFYHGVKGPWPPNSYIVWLGKTD